MGENVKVQSQYFMLARGLSANFLFGVALNFSLFFAQ